MGTRFWRRRKSVHRGKGTTALPAPRCAHLSQRKRRCTARSSQTILGAPLEHSSTEEWEEEELGGRAVGEESRRRRPRAADRGFSAGSSPPRAGEQVLRRLTRGHFHGNVLTVAGCCAGSRRAGECPMMSSGVRPTRRGDLRGRELRRPGESSRSRDQSLILLGSCSLAAGVELRILLVESYLQHVLLQGALRRHWHTGANGFGVGRWWCRAGDASG